MRKYNHIESLKLDKIPIAHPWVHKDRKNYFRQNLTLADSIDSISHNGILGLSIGAAEWVSARLSKYEQPPILEYLIEAMWVSMIDKSLLQDTPKEFKEELVWEKWQGPGRGPVFAGFHLLMTIYLTLKKGHFASPECTSLIKLAQYILPDKKPFKTWLELTIARLKMYHPYNKENVHGIAVPRISTDLTITYDINKIDLYHSEFIKEVNPENPYLNKHMFKS